MDRNESGMNELKYLLALHVQIVGDLHWNESKQKNILEFRGANSIVRILIFLLLGSTGFQCDSSKCWWTCNIDAMVANSWSNNQMVVPC
jgi:hypothetical protein